MPKRRTDDVVHVVMTDHYIQRRKPARDLLAPLAEKHGDYKGEVVLFYPSTLPGTADAELYAAVAQVKQNANLQEGIRRLEAAIERHKPSQAEFYFELGEAYWESGRPEYAIPKYRQATERSPEFWPAFHKLGLALFKPGQPEAAIAPLERASSLSSDATVPNDLALVYRQARRMDEAIASVQKAVGLNPDLSQAQNNLGGLLRERGDPAGAEAAFRKAIEAQPDLAAAHVNLGTIFVERQDFKDARFHFEKAIANASGGDPSLTDAHNALADVMSMQGEVGNAAAHYRAAIELDPESAPAHFGLGSILAMQGRRNDAVAHFQKAAASPDPTIREPALEALRKLKL
jgi:tetratricopeptide (TPR) repeat protein